MLQTIKKYEEEDRSAAAKKDRHIAKSRVEVIKANKEAIESKRMHNEREKEEVEVILAYQAKQDEKMTIRKEQEIGTRGETTGSTLCTTTRGRSTTTTGRNMYKSACRKKNEGGKGATEATGERKRRRGEVLEVLEEAETQTTMRSQT